MHAHGDLPSTADTPAPAFDPELSSLVALDDGWLVEVRVVSRLGAATRPASTEFGEGYELGVELLARDGFGCVPDPAAGDLLPRTGSDSAVVYRVQDDWDRVAARDPQRELHLALVCAMARTDGAFVGSELGIALALADHLATSPAQRARLRAIAQSRYMNVAGTLDPLVELSELPRAEAISILESLERTAWADGLLRDVERRLLEQVRLLLDVPFDDVDDADPAVRFVEDDHAA
jgi:hypothetical protein